MTGPGAPAPSRARLLLALAASAVAFAAADTYVVVLALPDMMGSAGVPIDELQRAAPIVSGFLLGYVAMLPLIGRIADVHGRVPVLVASLLGFSVGSLLTAVAGDLPGMVAGRFLQGVGGGGLVPATLALVADLYPAHRRGVPLGLVSAVQEVGSVLGPLFGAAVLAVTTWRGIFAVNLAVGLLLAAGIQTARSRPPRPEGLPEAGGAPGSPEGAGRGWPDLPGAALLVAAVAAGLLMLLRPAALLRGLTLGALWVPFVPGSRWLTPLGVAALVLAAAFVLRCLTARRPLVDLRAWGRAVRAADLPGALLLSASLAGVILAFATADPQVEVFSPWGGWSLFGSAVAAALFAVHLRRAAHPVVPAAALRARAAWGSLLVSFFVGAALIAALVDLPLFARTTVHPDSQLDAALVLVRFLVALPVGAVLGGWALRRVGAGAVTAIGMSCAAAAFVVMSRWGPQSLADGTATVVLLVGGLGFGLALAPVNAAVLAATGHPVHGVASALVVVARMVGMLVGISALTTLGLRRFYAEQSALPPMAEVCGGAGGCAQYGRLLQQAAIAQESVVFQGAAGCALAAGMLALVLFRGAGTREALPARTLPPAG